MLEVGALVELEITDVAYGGEFIGRYEDTVVFVRGAIIGERVIAEITRRQAKLYRAIVREVLVASDWRINHPWSLGAVDATGAADYGHLSLAGQREMKSLMLRNQLRRIGGETLVEQFSEEMLTVHSVEGGRDGSLVGQPDTAGWHYRTRIDVLKLATGVGMHLLRTNQLVALQEMPLASRHFAQLDLFGTAWDGYLPQQRMRLVAPSLGNPVAVVDGKVYRAPGVEANPQISELVRYRGEEYFYQIFAGSFWQIHENAPNALVRHVFDALDPQPGDTLVDLYCGSGLFSLVGAHLVGKRGKLCGFEGDARAVKSAQQNLAALSQARAATANIDQRNIGKLVQRADSVIADPPRAGLGVGAAKILGKSDARRIALISCDSASMARDISALISTGRKIESFTAVDIFPNTHYVETVCVLTRAR